MKNTTSSQRWGNGFLAAVPQGSDRALAQGLIYTSDVDDDLIRANGGNDTVSAWYGGNDSIHGGDYFDTVNNTLDASDGAGYLDGIYSIRAARRHRHILDQIQNRILDRLVVEGASRDWEPLANFVDQVQAETVPFPSAPIWDAISLCSIHCHREIP